MKEKVKKNENCKKQTEIKNKFFDTNCSFIAIPYN